jgi:hypothetical protein
MNSTPPMTDKAKHTAGPWVAEPCACGWSECRAIMSSCEKVAENVREANAHLIAAAPALRDALAAICSEFAQQHPLIVDGLAALSLAQGPEAGR